MKMHTWERESLRRSHPLVTQQKHPQILVSVRFETFKREKEITTSAIARTALGHRALLSLQSLHPPARSLTWKRVKFWSWLSFSSSLPALSLFSLFLFYRFLFWPSGDGGYIAHFALEDPLNHTKRAFLHSLSHFLFGSHWILFCFLLLCFSFDVGKFYKKKKQFGWTAFNYYYYFFLFIYSSFNFQNCTQLPNNFSSFPFLLVGSHRSCLKLSCYGALTQWIGFVPYSLV